MPSKSTSVTVSTIHPAPGEAEHGTADITVLDELPAVDRGRVYTMSAEAVSLDKQHKVGRFRHFEFHCDEPQWLGGDDAYPQPLTYLAASVAFCFLTQVNRYASMLKKRVTHAACRTEFDVYWDGSVLKGTLKSGVNEFRSYVTIESPESAEDVLRIIRLAKRGCFAEQLVRNPIPLKTTLTVNGEPLEISDEVVYDD